MANKIDTQSTVTLILNGEQTKTSLRDVTQAVNATRAALSRMNEADNPELYRQRIAELRRLTAAQRDLRDQINSNTEEQKSFWSEFKKGFGEISNLSAGVTIGNLLSEGISSAKDALQSLISSVITTYSTFQKYDAVLTNTLGDASASQKVLKMISKFAAETPFSMDELTGSFVKLVNRGIKPSLDEMKKMGDLAASQGKSFDELTEAILDAVTGEFERLKEFGIRASKNGDVVKLSFKGITQEVENTDVAIQAAILKFGAMDGVAGGMEAMSKRIGGVISNVGDNLDRIYNRIGESTGSFIFSVVSTFNSLLEVLGDSRTEVEKLTDQFKAQKETVSALEKNTVPLINRYDELKQKSSLNKDEQNELKKVIAQIADTIPSAVTQWDKYGNALGINTDKAREFVKVQKALLAYNNKEAIDATKERLDQLDKMQKSNTRTLNGGMVNASGGGIGTATMRRMTDDEIRETRVALSSIAAEIDEKRALLKGLTGGFMDDIGQKTQVAKQAIKGLNEMTVGELGKRLASLKKSLDDTVIGSKDYKKIMQDIADTEKVLSMMKSDKNPDAAVRKAEAYAKQLESIRSEYLQLTGAAKKGTIDDLDAQLALIDAKYNKVVDKLRKLAKDPRVAKEFNGDIDNINKVGGLRDQEKTGIINDKFTKDNSLDLKQNYDDLTGSINDEFSNKATGLQDSETDAMRLATSEEERLKVKEKFQDQELQLELAHLEALKQAQMIFGDNTTAIDKKISDAKRKIAENDVQNKDESVKKQQALDQQRYDFAKLITNGLASLVEITMGNSAIGIAMQKAITVAQLAIDTASAISSATAAMAKTSITPIDYAIKVGVMVVTILGNIAKAKNALSESGEVKAGPVKKAEKGALIPAGPSHGQGGIDLINNVTGDRIAEMEGGEPIMILSKDTYRNNRMLVNELLYNSQYRNGASVSVNTNYATRPATSMYQSGGMIPSASTASSANSSHPGNYSFDTSALEEEMRLTRKAIKDQQVVFNTRAYDEYKAREAAIRNSAKA